MLIQDGEEHWHVAYTMVKVQTRYGILLLMISLSLLGLRASDVLMETVDAYYGSTFWDQIKTQKKYATFLLIIWLLLKEFHRESHWSWDGEHSYDRLSKILQKEWPGWFSWTFELFIRKAKSGGYIFSKDLLTMHNQQHRVFTSRLFQICIFSLWFKVN